MVQLREVSGEFYAHLEGIRVGGSLVVSALLMLNDLGIPEDLP